MSPKSDKSLMSFAFKLRNYKGTDIGLKKKPERRRYSTKPSLQRIEAKIFSSLSENKKPRRHQSMEHPTLHSAAWNGNMIKPAKIPAAASTRVSEKYFEKFTDKNIANYKMHFGPRNGKEQVEWQCMLRTPPPKAEMKRASSPKLADDEY